MDAYYFGEDIPDIFRFADEVLSRDNNQEYNEDDDDICEKKEKKKKKKDKKDKKMKIKIIDDASSPKKHKIEKEKIKSRKEYETEMIELLSKIELYTRKLEELDPGKKKDSAKIASYNIKLRDMNDKLHELERQSGIRISELNIGTKFGRFMTKLKSKGRKLLKKTKKFCKHNKELIIGLATIVVPVVVSVVMKAVLHL